MKALRLIAGKTARKRIEDQGLTPDLVRLVLGASGGPKWLILQELDQYIFGHWLPQNSHKIDLIGSSIGAWRMACAAHPEPDKMCQHFKEIYFATTYEDGLSILELTQSFYGFLHKIFSDNDKKRITSNPKRNLHIVSVKGKGLAAAKNPYIETLGIAIAAARNFQSRENLIKYYQRVVLHSHADIALSDQWADYDRINSRLTWDVFADALMASGSIPFVSDAVRNLGGLGNGIFRDGGIIDYHFDSPFRLEEGIILYPHFYSHIVPGWFDKSRKTRRAKGETFDHMLMLAPSDACVASLPYGKIPDRKNFRDMDDATRIKYWQKVVAHSQRLAEEFQSLVDQPEKLIDSLEDAPE